MLISYNINQCIFPSTVIKCFALILFNGRISYANDPGPNTFVYNTVATLSCNDGYVLYGSETRTCRENSFSNNAIGEWNGTHSFCVLGIIIIGVTLSTLHCRYISCVYVRIGSRMGIPASGHYAN